MVGDDVGGGGFRSHRPNASTVEFLPVRVVGEEVSRAHAASPRRGGSSADEIVGAWAWRVRILAGFDPGALTAALTVLEGRPC